MNILVIGSINIDMVVKSVQFPKKGETIIGESFHTFFGGKGANQAVCASRLGSNVSFIGCVGNDINGSSALKNLSKNNVDTKAIKVVENESTGIASITVSENDNSIIIVKGANDKVSTEMIDDHLDLLKSSDLVLLQLEIPLDTVSYIVDVCYKYNITTVLNPAPAIKLDKELIKKVDYITPNETEYKLLFGEDYKDGLMKYPNKLIVTKGEHGIDYFNGTEIINIKAHKVKVIDTTGAGDSFNAGLSVGLVNNMSLEDAILFGNKVASISVGKLGAQSSMPYGVDLI